MGLAARIDAATPAERERYLDFLRVFAIGMVILGHWSVRVILEQDGVLVTGYLLEEQPASRWATLLWQVMPIFFLVGGRLNAESWRRARAAGEAPTAWVHRRARRLLYPALPLLAVLVAAAAVTYAFVHPRKLILDFGVAIFPLWFLAAYLLVTALTPWTLGLHERGRGVPLLVLCAAVAVAVDLVRFTVGGPMIGTQPAISGVNFVLVWVIIHQIGFLWAEGRLPERAGGQALIALAGAGALAVMIGSGLYPLAMVPIEGTPQPNNGSPPSAALIALALVQLGVALMLGRPVGRWLRRPWAWLPVAIVGPRLITLYLWHQAVMVAVANLLYPLGWFPVTQEVDGAWWALRPLWIGICLAVLAGVTAVAHPLTQPPDRGEAPRPAPMSLAAGVLLFGAGVGGLIGTRMAQEAMPLQLPLVPLVLVVAGLLALRIVSPRPRRSA